MFVFRCSLAASGGGCSWDIFFMIVNVWRVFVCRNLVVVVADYMLLVFCCIYCLTRIKKYTCMCKLMLYISPKNAKSLQLCSEIRSKEFDFFWVCVHVYSGNRRV